MAQSVSQILEVKLSNSKTRQPSEIQKPKGTLFLSTFQAKFDGTVGFPNFRSKSK